MMRHLEWILVFALFAPSAFAAQVVKVKGRSALINLQGDSASPGDSFYALENGKRKALIQISKIKGDKAIGKVMKGNAGAGMTLTPSGRSQGGSSGGAASSASSDSQRGSSGTSPSGRAYWGVMAGYAMDSMTSKVFKANGEEYGTIAMSGSGFSVNGVFDYELFSQVWFRGLAGVEMFNVTAGDAVCLNGSTNNGACDAKITYLSGLFIGRYAFAMGNFRPWLGLGIALMFPASKASTALASSSVGTTNAIVPAGGLDWFISPTTYIPIQAEYGMLPKSDQVDAHWIQVRVGIAFPF